MEVNLQRRRVFQKVQGALATHRDGTIRTESAARERDVVSPYAPAPQKQSQNLMEALSSAGNCARTAPVRS